MNCRGSERTLSLSGKREQREVRKAVIVTFVSLTKCPLRETQKLSKKTRPALRPGRGGGIRSRVPLTFERQERRRTCGVGGSDDFAGRPLPLEKALSQNRRCCLQQEDWRCLAMRLSQKPSVQSVIRRSFFQKNWLTLFVANQEDREYWTVFLGGPRSRLE